MRQPDETDAACMMKFSHLTPVRQVSQMQKTAKGSTKGDMNFWRV
jgi:hypothetical protein